MMNFYQLPGVAEASSIDHCKKGYFGRHGTNIVPVGPALMYSFKQCSACDAVVGSCPEMQLQKRATELHSA